MKLVPASLSAVPFLLLSTLLALAPQPAAAANGPSHFIIQTPSTSSPWQAGAPNPVVWTYSKSASPSRWVRRARGGARGRREPGPAEYPRAPCRRIALPADRASLIDSRHRGWRRASRPSSVRRVVLEGGAPAQGRDGEGRQAAIPVPGPGRRRPSRLTPSCPSSPPALAADILQFDVELLRLSGTGLLLVAKNGASRRATAVPAPPFADTSGRALRVAAALRQCRSPTARPSSTLRGSRRATTTLPSSWTRTMERCVSRQGARPTPGSRADESLRLSHNPLAFQVFTRSSKFSILASECRATRLPGSKCEQNG